MPGCGTRGLFSETNVAYSSDICKALESATKDEWAKAVIMRVNSLGGSAASSEMIWNAARQAKEKKPLVASMANVAGSGGYYVSCGANAIFGNEITITASIDVVGGKVITSAMWQNLEVNWVGCKRGANADLFNVLRQFDDLQRAKLTLYIDEIYTTFKTRVQEGRGNKLTKPIEELAGGHVYTRTQAREFGLIDRIGGLSSAIRYATALARISDYEVRVFPPPSNMFTTMLQIISSNGECPTDISAFMHIEPLLEVINQINPQRGRALLRALNLVHTIRLQGAALIMPQEIIVY